MITRAYNNPSPVHEKDLVGNHRATNSKIDQALEGSFDKRTNVMAKAYLKESNGVIGITGLAHFKLLQELLLDSKEINPESFLFIYPFHQTQTFPSQHLDTFIEKSRTEKYPMETVIVNCINKNSEEIAAKIVEIIITKIGLSPPGAMRPN